MSKRIVSPRNGFLNEDRWIETRQAKNKTFIGFMGNQSFIGGEGGGFLFTSHPAALGSNLILPNFPI